MKLRSILSGAAAIALFAVNVHRCARRGFIFLNQAINILWLHASMYVSVLPAKKQIITVLPCVLRKHFRWWRTR